MPGSTWCRRHSSHLSAGFPVLVPGQEFSHEILAFIRDLDTPEIHWYQLDFGYRVYTEKAIETCRAATNRRGDFSH